MILRGLWLLARGDAVGIKEFDNSLNGFTASLAPLIAFPLVGAGISVLDGQWKPALIGFLSRLCAVLAVPVVVHAYARWVGRDAFWLRTATVINWSFWVLVPLLLVAAFLGATLVEVGLPMQDGEYFAMAVMGGFMLWYHWIIVRAGLGLGAWHAAALVALSSLAITLFTAAPVLLDFGAFGPTPGK